MTKVSILMPVYNAEKYLKEAIDSIIYQEVTDWELILINDGSTDNSESIISSYKDSRIHYIKNPENLGLIKTLNKGIDLCKGEYIARMDADDISHRDRLKKQVSFLDEHPDYMMCGTDASVINNEGIKTGHIKNLNDNNFLQINLLFSPPFIHPTMMIRKSILSANKYDERQKHVEDYELWCRLAKLGKISNLNEELLSYRWHDSNVSVLNNTIQEELKEQIIKHQLKELDLVPSQEELYCHTVTFKLYKLGHRQEVSVAQFKDISDWFTKIIKQNKQKNIYNQCDLKAFLWARWITLCISQKKYTKAIPSFFSLHPKVLIRLAKLLLFLKNK